MRRHPRVVSLFSGAGGLDLGLELAGFRTLAQLECDRDCVETLSANHARRRRPILLVNERIADVDPKSLMRELRLRRGELELLAGGPPCQAFTTTGRRRALTDERGNVVREYLRWLRAFQPQYFLMENVTGFLSAALFHRPLIDRGIGHPPMDPEEMKGSVLRWFLGELAASGYTVTWGVLDAVDFGVPQFRQRAFLIGTRSGHPVFLPRPTHHAPTDAPATRPWRTLTDALKDLNDPDPFVQPLSDFKVRVYEHILPGTNWRSLPRWLQQRTMGRAFEAEGGKSGWWRRLAWDRPTPTILTMPDHSSTGLVHPSETRCLSVRECARCQTFPDSWIFTGAARSQYRQIGNAVPVQLARSLGRQILRHMLGRWDSTPGPPVWRQLSANQRLGTWGWVSNEGDGSARILVARRSDHIDWAEPMQQSLPLT